MKMDGSVVAGSMSQNRLNSESVGGIAQSIRQLGNGGEVRIRLKPDHLGELHLKVMTGGKSGSEVGLQIHASDDQAKKILEESLGSLRESLASQNLSLAKVDVQVAQPSSSANLGNDSNQDRPGLAGQQNFSSNSGDGNRGNSSQGRSSGADTAPAGGTVKATPRQAAAFGGGGAARAVASSRLDVIA
jgi:flagellar hook-length control protein FliK